MVGRKVHRLIRNVLADLSTLATWNLLLGQHHPPRRARWPLDRLELELERFDPAPGRGEWIGLVTLETRPLAASISA